MLEGLVFRIAHSQHSFWTVALLNACCFVSVEQWELHLWGCATRIVDMQNRNVSQHIVSLGYYSVGNV